MYFWMYFVIYFSLAVLQNRILPSLYRSRKHSEKDVSSINTGNVQGLRANQIAALSTDGVLFPKSIRNMSEISEVSEVSELCLKFEHCFF